MINRITLLLFIGLAFWGCEEDAEPEPDTTPPTVSIQSPITNQSINEIVTIVVETNDNEGISKVEFYIDDSLFFTDLETPYQYEWNTTQYEDNSEHIVKVISYDTSDNTTESQPIMLIVDNTGSYPQAVNITSIIYTLTEMTIIWNTSSDTDFDHYELLVSESEYGDKTLIDEITEINDTSYVLTDFDPSQQIWYWLSVSDISGLSSIGSGYYVLDNYPTQVEVYPINFQDGSFTVIWSINEDDDFQSYSLYESLSPSMTNKTEIFTTDSNIDTSYVVDDVEESIYRYYEVTVKDIWGLESVSNVETASSFIQFNKTFGGYCHECSGQQTSDGGYIIGAENGGNGYLKKVDSFGNQEWSQTFSGADLRLKDVKEDNNGYIICGMKWSGASWNLWIVKTDLQGFQQWEKTFAGEVGGWATSIQQTTDGGYIVGGGTTANQSSPTHKIWIIKTDGEGNEEWSRTIDQNSGWANSISQTTDGGFIAVGSNDIGIILIKLDYSGNTEWTKTFDGGGADRGRSVKESSDGGYIIVGRARGVNGYYTDAWLIKTDSQGNEEWNKMFGGDMVDEFESLEETVDNGIVMVGRTYSYGSGEDDVWLVKTDSQGDTLWTRSFGGSGEDGGYSVMQTQDDGYIITGYTHSYGSGSPDIWLIKTDPEGNTVPYGD